MISKSRNRLNRKISMRKRLAAMLVLWALSCAAFPVSILGSQRTSTPQGLIYCPLSKKLQPIKPPERKKDKEPFDAMCVSNQTKDLLYREIVLKTPWRAFTLDANGFEKLAFDYLAQGKTALDKLPFAPNAPRTALVERVVSGVAASNYGKFKLSWKNAISAAFLPNLKPRPPTTGALLAFFVKPAYRSATLSRRIAPRAPPLS